MPQDVPLATPIEVAAYLAVPEPTLKQWRRRGVGPRYKKCGQLVRYDWADVQEWLSENSHDAADAVA